MATAPLLAPYRAQQFSAKGEAVLRSHREATQNEKSTSELVSNFTNLSYTFPLKLLTPRISSKDAIASARRERLRSPSSNNSTSSRSKYNSDPNAYVFTREEEAEQEERDRLAAAKLPTKVLQQHPDSNWSEKAIAALFIVGYGGGLVSGDCVSLSIDCGQKTALLLLTQGSTKVFKTRESFASKQDAQMRSHSLEGKVLPASTDQSSGPSTPFSTSTTSSPSPTTSQLFRCLVRGDSTLILLPDPVTCFSQAKYFQTQFFDLRDRKTSSLVLLDWITPGRTRSVGGDLSHGRGNVGFNRETMNREENEKEASKGIAKFGHLSGPELWQFESYRSRNEIRVQGEIVVRDLLFLDQEMASQLPPISNLNLNFNPTSSTSTSSTSTSSTSTSSTSTSSTSTSSTSKATSLATRLSPYTCYATLFLFGPDCASTLSHLKSLYRRIQQRVLPQPEDLIWSLSELGPAGGISSMDGNGKEMDLKDVPEAAVIRIAGKETESVRVWLRENLEELKKVVGSDLYAVALGR